MVEPQEGLDWERWHTVCHQVESLGFDSLWRSDHLTSLVSTTHRPTLETWVSLTMLASWTQRLEFGTLVSPITFRQPGLLASMALALNALSNGRLVLGLGAGWNQAEHNKFAIPFPSTSDRLSALASAVPFIRELWDDLAPAPSRKPPILIGGRGRQRTLRIVARFADEWNGFGLSPDQYVECVEVLLHHCSDVGRDPRTIAKSLMAGVIVGRDDAELQERIAELGRLLPSLAEAEPARMLENLRAAGPGRWIVGSPTEIVDQLRRFSAIGVDRVMLQHYLLDDSEVLKLLAKEVLPHISLPQET